MAALVCPACGGRNPVEAATCAFCQCPVGPVHRPLSRLVGGWPWPRVAFLVLVLLLFGVLLALASRATPLLPGAP